MRNIMYNNINTQGKQKGHQHGMMASVNAAHSTRNAPLERILFQSTFDMCTKAGSRKKMKFKFPKRHSSLNEKKIIVTSHAITTYNSRLKSWHIMISHVIHYDLLNDERAGAT